MGSVLQVVLLPPIGVVGPVAKVVSLLAGADGSVPPLEVDTALGSSRCRPSQVSGGCRCCEGCLVEWGDCL